MKEKELRLALVCYGGVSLAVYMHGVTKEFQKLLFASKELHGLRDPFMRHTTDARKLLSTGLREIDSEIGYFSLLQRIGEHLELRVLVDIIAGASAGGINGIFLAQAIAHNMPLDPLRDLWLHNADIEELLDTTAASGKWSKLYMRPLVWAFGKWQDRQIVDMLGPGATGEMRRKLSRFVRSRWFKPPFSGAGFARMLYNGMKALAAPDGNRSSLLPPGYPLDLFVTVTDYFGFTQKLRLNSPREISEREHRLIIDFHDSGDAASGQRWLGDPADLAFAARATASFPGAFPPALLGEMDGVLSQTKELWPGRAAFVARAFRRLIQAGSNPESAAFIDGSVLNNKPFGPAIEALGRRPAHREVDRRIVYIEPNPRQTLPRSPNRAPGFFSALRASLSDIPRNQPIRDDLEWVQAHSTQVERINQVIESMRDDVQAAIAESLGLLDMSHVTASVLAEWRLAANSTAGRSAGFTYAAYVELKMARMLDATAAHLEQLSSQHGQTVMQDVWRDRLDRWARGSGILPLGQVHTDIRRPDEEVSTLPWVVMLRRADVHFRIRRLRFVIRTLNRLYASTERDIDHQMLDQVKQRLYAMLADINARLQARSAPAALCTAAAASEDTAAVLDMLTLHLDLPRMDDLTDARVAEALMIIPDADVRRDLILGFVGFAYFDIATFPMLQNLSMDEFDEIKVDRISPEDANAIRPGGAQNCLKGINFSSFGAFFSRAYRENDYLWGRLHAADRLIDIIMSCVEPEHARSVPVQTIKRDIFTAILHAERTHLALIPDVFGQITREIAQQAERPS